MGRTPIDSKLSSRGRWALKFGILFFVLGLLQNDAVLLQLSLFLLILLPLCDLLARLNMRGISYERTMPRRVYARKPFEVTMRVRNRNRFFQRFTISVDDELLTKQASNWQIDSLGAGGSLETRRRSHMPRRGRVASGRVVLRSTFPFGLVDSVRSWEEPVDLVVFPSPLYPHQARQSAEDPVHDLDSSLRQLPLDMGEFRGLREFRSGDRIRTVHWGASARQGRLMVREFDPPLGEVYSFVFHSYRPRGVLVTPQSFERCMQLLCGFFLECQRKSIPFEFTASFHKWQTVEVRDPQQLEDVLELLATAPQRTERNPQRFVERVRRHANRGRCFVVSNTPIDHWVGLLQQLDVPVDCVDSHTWRSREQLVPRVVS